jgi:hypothetical protein
VPLLFVLPVTVSGYVVSFVMGLGGGRFAIAKQNPFQDAMGESSLDIILSLGGPNTGLGPRRKF